MNKDDLKAALANRDFDRAQSLILAWGTSVKAEMRAASGQTERQRIFEEAVSFAEGNIYFARVIRAHIAAELHANSASFLYCDTDLERHRWQIQA
jgi:hypothetical protein